LRNLYVLSACGGELGLNMDRRKFDGLRYNDQYARSPRRIDRVNYIKYIEQEK